MNVNEPETRGVALALHVVLDDLGRGAGPGLVALLITWMGRQAAFSLSILGWIPCGLCIRAPAPLPLPPGPLSIHESAALPALRALPLSLPAPDPSCHPAMGCLLPAFLRYFLPLPIPPRPWPPAPLHPELGLFRSLSRIALERENPSGRLGLPPPRHSTPGLVRKNLRCPQRGGGYRSFPSDGLHARPSAD